MTHSTCRFYGLSLSLLITAVSALTARGDVLHGIGIVGDGSNAPAANGAPPVIMHTLRGLNFGPSYAYDYGYFGASSSSIIQPGDAVAQLAAQAQAGNVSLALISIGENDMFGAVASVADGSLAGAALAAQQAFLVNNIETAVNTLLATGVKVVLGGVSDVADSPNFAAIMADPAAKARVENAIATIESQLSAFAQSNHIGFVDFFGLEKAVYDSGDFVVGGVHIDLHTTGPDPHNFFQDNFNAGVVIRGEIANLWMQGANMAYGAGIPLLTDQEILNYAGITTGYVGETFQAANPLASFVTSVPEPSSAALLGVGLCGLLISAITGHRRIR
ncbi:MAG TPA: PEP-CTERM sorting domain-containing protein [Pirellulales bacterium]|nr:PEP-CTERM sorting domain-containing protein [Pirellulales bacterium]